VERQLGLTAETLWSDVATRLRETLNDTTFQTWFGSVTGAELDGDTFVVGVPNDFTREWIEGHFLDLLRSGAQDAGGRQLRIRLRVDRADPPVAAAAPAARALPEPLPVPLLAAPRVETPGINPKYTFDSFVIGSSNRFAHAAALASSTGTPASGRRTCCMRSRTS
jgi:chromosomal replication initiator protein